MGDTKQTFNRSHTSLLDGKIIATHEVILAAVHFTLSRRNTHRHKWSLLHSVGVNNCVNC